MTRRNITRRAILKLPAAAAASGALRSLRGATPYSMPGLYPARVVGVTHSGASVGMAYQTAPIQNMIRQGMQTLTGTSNYITAWRKLFQPGDVVANSSFEKLQDKSAVAIVNKPVPAGAGGSHEAVRRLSYGCLTPALFTLYDRGTLYGPGKTGSAGLSLSAASG